MGLSLPSFPYPPASDGYWSPVTSTLNWCEEDYYATHYSAEIINSLTNIAFIALAYKGISSCIRNGHDTVFLLAFVSYLVIGLGSFCFHTTLTYSTQLLDELAMIYTTCIMFYAVFSHNRTPPQKILLGLLVAAIATFTSLYYHYLKDPLFHQNMFAFLTAIVFARCIYTMEVRLRPSWRAGKPRPGPEKAGGRDREKEDQRNLAILKTMWQMLPIGVGSVALGFLIWSLDNAFCPTLRRWRREVGLPWGVLLEGHGWWHIFTSVAQYYSITWAIMLRYCERGDQDDVMSVWPSLISMPTVERRVKEKAGSSPRQVRSGKGGKRN